MERNSEQKNNENKGRTRTDERNACSGTSRNEHDNNGCKTTDKSSKDVDKKRSR